MTIKTKRHAMNNLKQTKELFAIDFDDIFEEIETKRKSHEENQYIICCNISEGRHAVSRANSMMQ